MGAASSKISHRTGLGVVEKCLADLRDVLGSEPAPVKHACVGVFYTAVELSSGQVGVAFTPRGLTDTVCCPKSAAAALPAGTLAGRDAWELAGYALAPSALRRSVGVAALNAISALAIERIGVPGGRLVAGFDALDAAEVRPSDTVTMVGAFAPFIKKLKGKVGGLCVIDNHPEAFKPEELGMWRSPYQAADALAEADVVIISGSAMVEGELDTILRAAGNARRVVLAGPTASPWPPPFFESGIDVLGGIRVLDPARMLQIVAEGGSGYSFGQAAEKVCILRDRTAGETRLAGNA